MFGKRRTPRRRAHEHVDTSGVHVVYVRAFGISDVEPMLREAMQSIPLRLRYEFDPTTARLMVLGTVSLRRLVGALESTGFEVSETPFPTVVEDVPAEDAALAEPLVEEPLVEEPLVEEPLVEEPLVEEPLVAEPLVEEPLVEEPLVEEPSTGEAAAAAEMPEHSVAAAGPEEVAKPRQRRFGSPILHVVVALVCFALGVTLATFRPEAGSIDIPLYAVAMVLAGIYPAVRVVNALRRRQFHPGGLVLIAAVGAALLREWSAGALLLVLHSFLEWFGTAMRRVTRHTPLRPGILPDVATRLVYDPTGASEEVSEERVPVDEIAVDDLVLVEAGEIVPVDGVIVDGSSTVNESILTGETLSVEKGIGAPVYAGSRNEGDAILVRVRQTGDRILLRRIAARIDRAYDEGTPIEPRVARYVRWFSLVLVYAAIAVMFLPSLAFGAELSVWIERGLILLVLAVPSALSWAVPASVGAALARAARSGVIVSSFAQLRRLAEATAVVFNKRRTVTIGTMGVTEVLLFGDWSEEAILQVAASLEQGVDHPIARAIVAEAEELGKEAGFSLFPVVDRRVIRGYGVTGMLETPDGPYAFRVGSLHLMKSHGLAWDEEFDRLLHEYAEKGNEVAFVASDKRLLAAIALKDSLRKESRRFVERLRRLGIRRIMLMSGDTAAVAEFVARELEVDEVLADLSQEDKAAHVEAWRKGGERVVVVSDRGEDGAALKAADVGIVLGASLDAGSALAEELVSVMPDDLMRVPYALSLSRRARKMLAQNVVIACIAKVAAVVLAIAGVLKLWSALVLDTLAALLIAGNIFLLLRRHR